MKWPKIQADFDILKKYVNPDTIVDVGAYIGYTTKAFIETFPNARVVAIEPIKESFEQLTKEMRKFNNVELHCVAAGPRKGKLTLSSPHEELTSVPLSGMSAVYGRGHMKRTVEMLPLTDIVDSADLIKIHVQGYVREVIEGAMPIIEKHHPVLVIEGHIDIEDVVALLPKYKYETDVGWMRVYI